MGKFPTFFSNKWIDLFVMSPGPRSCDPGSMQHDQESLDLYPGVQKKTVNPFCISLGNSRGAKPKKVHY